MLARIEQRILPRRDGDSEHSMNFLVLRNLKCDLRLLNGLFGEKTGESG